MQAASFGLLLCVLVYSRKKLHQIGVPLENASVDLFLERAHSEGHDDLVLFAGFKVSKAKLVGPRHDRTLAGKSRT